MQTAAVAELKASLSEYLGRVKTGEEILVTDRGVPVAKVVPLKRGQDISSQMIAMEKCGKVHIASCSLPDSFWSIPRPDDLQAMARSFIADERAENR
jgi:prevent-host-death family protein